MLYTKENLKKFVKEVLEENKKSFLIYEYEPADWCSIMSAITELKEKDPRALLSLTENDLGPGTGTTPLGPPSLKPINVGKNIVSDDAAGKILASINAVIEIDAEDYQAQGYEYREALEMASRDAAQTLEVIVADLNNNLNNN